MWQDLKHGLRMFAKNPGFTLVAIVSIAIGVGANAAMFSLADGLVLRPLQVPRANEIVAVSGVPPRVGGTFITNTLVSYRDYVDVRDRAQSFNGLLAYSVLVTGLTERPGEPAQTALGLSVSTNFFDVLELQPALGRFFLPDEDRVPGRDAVAVLSYEAWSDRFGADPAVLNRRIRLGDVDFTIVGVAPAGFEGMHLALHPVYYVPLAMTSALPGGSLLSREQRDIRSLTVKGRLKRGVTLERARQETSLIATGLERAYPDTNRNYGLLVRTDFDARLEERGPSAPSAFMLMALAFVVLLVACANVAGLLMSRAPAREREIALRLAIGGGRIRVTRQLVTEGGLLAVGGGALGLALAYGGVELMHRLPLVSDIGVRLIFALDQRAVVVGVVLAAASALFSSLLPAWRATRRANLVETMRAATGGGLNTRLWGRNGLVVGQIALSVVLLTVSVFFARAFDAQLRQPGFRTTQILLSSYEPRLARYDARQTEQFYRLLKERLRALPGVTSTGMTSVMPLNQDNREPLAIVPDGFELPPGTESMVTLSSRIDEGYLDTMRIPVVSGRGIRATDTADTPRVVLVNQAMAARYWPGQDVIGKRIRLMGREGRPWAEVVGVTADIKVNFIAEGPTPLMYLSQYQDPGARSTLLVASTGDAAALAAPLRTLVRELEPAMPIAGVRTIEEFYYGNAIGIVMMLTRITGGMGLLGLTLAMVGLYGLVSFVVARRTREIGIRMAVGAQTASVLRMVLRHGFVLAAAGTAFGIVVCVGISGLLRSIFPTIGTIDLVTYIAVVATLVIVTLLAAYVPARRAAHIDPLVALRQE
jgi:predicted permease